VILPPIRFLKQYVWILKINDNYYPYNLITEMGLECIEKQGQIIEISPNKKYIRKPKITNYGLH